MDHAASFQSPFTVKGQGFFSKAGKEATSRYTQPGQWDYLHGSYEYSLHHSWQRNVENKKCHCTHAALQHAGPRCLPEVKGLELAALTKQSLVESQYLCVSHTHCFTCLHHPTGIPHKLVAVQSSSLSWRVEWSSSDLLRLLLCFWWWEDGKSDSLWCISLGGFRGRHFGLRGAVDEVGTPARNVALYPGFLPKNQDTTG